MSSVGVGFTLQPELELLERAEPLYERADYFEVAPETTWRAVGERLSPNGFHRYFLELGERYGAGFVAHGVGYSVGSACGADATRRARWRELVSRDNAQFSFRWYTDHLGVSSLAGQAATLPLPLPMTQEVAGIVRERLLEMQRVVPDVGVENSVFYFAFGDPLDEPAFLANILSAPRTHLLLDLHNVYTSSRNFGFDPEAYLSRLDLSRVIEIHVSGGSDSDPRWLASGRVMRLDGHDDAVPEEVFALCERWAPRCPRLRGITLERMEGTVTSQRDVDELSAELDRVRWIAERCR